MGYSICNSYFNMRFRLLVVLTFLIFGGFFIFRNYQSPCANSRSCKESLKLIVDNNDTGTFAGRKVTPPEVDLAAETFPTDVLGEAAGNEDKHIYVDLTTQTLTAYEGDRLFLETKVSSGRWGRTPAGEFRIWEKLRATKMSGGRGSDYYYLPNVPYVMFFSNDEVAAGRGFALHGTYWHNNFGHPMSHGCVNMRTIDAQKLYGWVGPAATGNVTLATKDNPGTVITIYGETPD